MSTRKNRHNSQRGSVYNAVSTRSSPTTSRSSSPTSSIASVLQTTDNASPESDEDIDVRTSLEKELFELVNNGKIKETQDFLKTHAENSEFDINKRDSEGLSALHHCVLKNDPEMMNVILEWKGKAKVQYMDPLLQAIKDNNVQMVLKLWEFKELTEPLRFLAPPLDPSMKKKLVRTPDFSVFSVSGVTSLSPLLMAAQCGHYELIEFLYSRKERLPELHKLNCDCAECKSSSKSRNRIHILKGLTNPTYMAFMAGVVKGFDPILEAFAHIKKINNFIYDEPEVREEYKEILTNIKQFPVDLIALCRNVEEAKLLLQKETGYRGVSCSLYPRLLLAIENEQKEFVAQTNAQAVLHEEWIGEPWITHTTGQKVAKAIVIIGLSCFYPIIAPFVFMTYCCSQDTFLMQFITAPINRYYPSVISYLVYITLIFTMNTLEKADKGLGIPSHFLPWFVGLFEVSHLVTFLRNLFRTSLRTFLKSGWSIFELVNHFFFIITIVLWIMISSRTNNLGAVKIGSGKFHIRSIKTLEPNDILLLSEATTAIASTMAVLRFLRYIVFHETLGPLQIALGKMTGDILKFAFFYALIVVSFSLGTQYLYRPYKDDIDGCHICDIGNAMQTYAWSLFTLSDAAAPNVPAIIVVNGNQGNGMESIKNHHDLTERVGTIIYCAHHIICVTIMSNMLVGVMSSTYGKILDNVTAEWKFGRTMMWIYYIRDTIVPAPFNLCLNIPLLFGDIFKCLQAKCGCKKLTWNCPCGCCNTNKVTDEVKKEMQQQYPILIRRLIQRYFRSKSSLASEDPPAVKDIKHLQNQVVELRKFTTMSLDYHSNPNSGTNVSGKDTAPQPSPNTPSGHQSLQQSPKPNPNPLSVSVPIMSKTPTNVINAKVTNNTP